MAKSKKKDKKDGGAQAEAVEAIRAAIERGLQVSAEGAAATRERTRELVDEIAAAAGRVRQSLEDMRVLDELRRLRTEVEALASRVASPERPGASTPAKTSTGTASKPAAAKRATTSRARKPAARKPAARKSAAKKSTTSARKSTSTRSRAKKPAATKAAASKSAASKPAASKPAAEKPAGSS